MKLLSKPPLNFHPQVLEHEMEHIVESVTHDLSHQHLDLETYLKTLKKEKDAWMEEDVKPAAVKNLTKSLVMQEISRVEGIKFENEDLQTEAANMLAEMQQFTEPKTFEKQLKNDDFIHAVTLEAASRVLNRKTFARMKEIATGQFSEEKKEADQAEKPKSVNQKTAQTTEAADESTEETNPKAKKINKKCSAG